jgi:hypothetical protein
MNLKLPLHDCAFENKDSSNISTLLNLQKTCDIRFISAIMKAKTIPTILI